MIDHRSHRTPFHSPRADVGTRILPGKLLRGPLEKTKTRLVDPSHALHDLNDGLGVQVSRRLAGDEVPSSLNSFETVPPGRVGVRDSKNLP